jgi:hypothetical protein
MRRISSFTTENEQEPFLKKYIYATTENNCKRPRRNGRQRK